MRPKDYINKKTQEEALKAFGATQLNSNQESSPYFVGKINASRTKITDPEGRQYDLIFTGNPKQFELAQRLSNDTAVVNAQNNKTINVDGDNKSLYILTLTVDNETFAGTYVIYDVKRGIINYIPQFDFIIDGKLELEDGIKFSPSGKHIIRYGYYFVREDPSDFYGTFPITCRFRVFRNFKMNGATEGEGSISTTLGTLFPVLYETLDLYQSEITESILEFPPIPSAPTVNPVTPSGVSGYHPPVYDSGQYISGFFPGGRPYGINEVTLFTEDIEGDLGASFYFHITLEAYNQTTANTRYPQAPFSGQCNGVTVPTEFPDNSSVGDTFLGNFTKRDQVYLIRNVMEAPSAVVVSSIEYGLQNVGIVQSSVNVPFDNPPVSFCTQQSYFIGIVSRSSFYNGPDLGGVVEVGGGVSVSTNFSINQFFPYKDEFIIVLINLNFFTSGEGNPVVFTCVKYEPGNSSSVIVSDSYSYDLMRSITINGTNIISNGDFFLHQHPPIIVNDRFMISGYAQPFQDNEGAYKQMNDNTIMFINTNTEDPTLFEVKTYKVDERDISYSGFIDDSSVKFTSSTKRFKHLFTAQQLPDLDFEYNGAPDNIFFPKQYFGFFGQLILPLDSNKFINLVYPSGGDFIVK